MDLNVLRHIATCRRRVGSQQSMINLVQAATVLPLSGRTAAMPHPAAVALVALAGAEPLQRLCRQLGVLFEVGAYMRA